MFQISDIDAFLNVVKYKSFSIASREMHVSQAAVSMRIKSLEKEAGIPLFYRDKNQVRLTPAGQALLPYAQEMRALDRSARETLSHFKQGVKGTLTIAASAAVCSWLLPRIFRKVYQTCPEIEILFQTCFTEEIINRVADGDVQFGIVRKSFPSLSDDRFFYKLLSSDNIYFAAHPSHPIFKRQKINIETISKIPLIVYASGSGYWPHVKNIFDNKNLIPNVAFHVNDLNAAKILTNLGTHICCLSEYALKEEGRDGDLQIINVEDYTPVTRYSLLIYRRDIKITAVMKEFLAIINSLEMPGARIAQTEAPGW